MAHLTASKGCDIPRGMKVSRFLAQVRQALIVISLGLPFTAHAATTLVIPNVYEVDEGVAFTLAHSGSSDFVFNWSDPSAPFDSFSSIADPTLILTVGETYTFERITGAHPFVIMDASAATFMSGTNGSYVRTTTNGASIDSATLSPIANFTADPGPTDDLIQWTPTQAGEFWYTCWVTGHRGMSGAITVVPEPSATGLVLGGAAALAFGRRRRRPRARD